MRHLDASGPPRTNPGGWLARAWPWQVLVLMIVPAIWHVVDFPEDVDDEIPGVERPTFNVYPPPAYRLAEPGDTIDRVGIYLAAAVVVVASIGFVRSRTDPRLWPTALVLAIAGLWHVATPGPTFDGWHGLGWRVILARGIPDGTRVGVGVAAAVLSLVVGLNLWRSRGWLRFAWDRAGMIRVRSLLVLGTLLCCARQGDYPWVGPPGYWSRWMFDWGLLCLLMALVRSLRLEVPTTRLGRVGWSTLGGLGWAGLVMAGINLTWYHRPLSRLHEVEPGRIYISAMPTLAGLRVAHDRHHFRTIINIFPEDTSQRSPLLPQEEQFVRETGVRYIRTTSAETDADDFLDKTLALAQDPDAWPILLHCHGCMDRSPAWMGIYRFLIQGRSLDEIMKEIEAHRGYRPKASITLLFNRVLADRAPERYRADPTAAVLRRSAHGNTSYRRRPEPPALSRTGETPVRP